MNTPACRFITPGPNYDPGEDFAEFGPPLTLRRRVENYCWQLGLIRMEYTDQIQNLAKRLVELGDTEDRAYAEACKLADEVAKHLTMRPTTI